MNLRLQAMQLASLRKQRERCAPLVSELNQWEKQVVTQCNVCGSEHIAVVTKEDRYGNAIRSGLCRYCGLVFLIDRLTMEGYGRFYQNVYRPLVSAQKDRSVTATSMQKEQASYGRDLIRAFHGFINVQPKATLLDIGGSTGIIASEYVGAYGVTATILDPSADELEVAKAAGHRTICGLFETWQNEGEQYDIVLCCRTIDHFFDLKGSLRKLHELCKPEGYVVIDIVDVESVRTGAGCLEAAIKIDHCYYLCGEVAPAILASAGLEVVRSEIATNAGRVTYLCRPAPPKNELQAPETWIVQRLRDLQYSNISGLLSRGWTDQPVNPLRRKLYRIRQGLTSGAKSN